MKWLIDLFSSTLGRKLIMALTGLFLISFLVIHCTINAMIFLNDDGVTFSRWGHFMGTNPVIRTLEIGLVAGFLIHIIQGLSLWRANHAARPVKYSVSKVPANGTWYSRSMGILGTLLLLFLIMHTSQFWIPNRTNQFTQGEELPLYKMMFEVFSNPWIVFFYLVGCVSLFWHLLHGFASAFQSLGLNHLKYNGIISFVGAAFSVIVPIIFALMPVAVYFRWVN